MTENEVHRIHAHLVRLLDEEPRLVLTEVPKLQALAPNDVNVKSLAASFLVDAGQLVGDYEAVRRGSDLFEEILASHRANDEIPPAELTYNLANGLDSLSLIDRTPTPGWYLATHPVRLRARRLYWDSFLAASKPALRLQALTNLGNSLSRAHRWIEAYDCYSRACKIDSANGPVALQLALLTSRRSGTSETWSLARYYWELAMSQRAQILAICGPQAVTQLEALQIPEVDSWESPQIGELSPYRRFVLQHRLMLAPTFEIDPSIPDWDDLDVGPISVPIESAQDPPPIFAMLNCLKQEFVEARKLLFQASVNQQPDERLYVNTLDYAIYGSAAAKLCFAQRSGMDLLDRIAVAVDLHLGIGTNPRKIDFRTYWRNKAETEWTAGITEEVQSDNLPVIALSEIAADLKNDGFLTSQVDRRNASTHRFTVLHEYKSREAVSGVKYIERYVFDEFLAATIETLQLTRAAIIYLVEFVMRRERREANDDQSVPMFLRYH